MSVVEYTSNFNSLGTYVPTVMADNTLKMHRYKKGLNNRIQSALPSLPNHESQRLNGCCNPGRDGHKETGIGQ
ncbi:hypothetical protein F511_45634 [Dorcoceras hygrometricum]|uniref:Retrotransposon gag domain-containing protein n=1 Tax=Dorcoceras hygrometricum TaxID=472368 RepID=A0A2Z6ZW02_9LAMI|nr:hypothetical protein F511_45634 [Dorcoceras hygrometricum]